LRHVARRRRGQPIIDAVEQQRLGGPGGECDPAGQGGARDDPGSADPKPRDKPAPVYWGAPIIRLRRTALAGASLKFVRSDQAHSSLPARVGGEYPRFGSPWETILARG